MALFNNTQQTKDSPKTVTPGEVAKVSKHNTMVSDSPESVREAGLSERVSSLLEIATGLATAAMELKEEIDAIKRKL